MICVQSGQLQSIFKPFTISYQQQSTFQVVRFAIPQEVADDHNGQDQEDDHEDLEVEIHVLAHGPADNNDERCIKQRRLYGGPDAVEERKVLLKCVSLQR